MTANQTSRALCSYLGDFRDSLGLRADVIEKSGRVSRPITVNLVAISNVFRAPHFGHVHILDVGSGEVFSESPLGEARLS